MPNDPFLSVLTGGGGKKSAGADPDSVGDDVIFRLLLAQQFANSPIQQQEARGQRSGIGSLINSLVTPYMTAKAMVPVVKSQMKAQSEVRRLEERKTKAQTAQAEATAALNTTKNTLAPLEAAQKAQLQQAQTEAAAAQAKYRQDLSKFLPAKTAADINAKQASASASRATAALRQGQINELPMKRQIDEARLEQVKAQTAETKQKTSTAQEMDPLKAQKLEKDLRNADRIFAERQQKFPLEMATAEEKLARMGEAKDLQDKKLELAKANLDIAKKKLDKEKSPVNAKTVLDTWRKGLLTSQYGTDASGAIKPHVFQNDLDAIDFAQQLQNYKQFAMSKAGVDPNQMTDVVVVTVPGRLYGTSGYKIVSADRAKVEKASGAEQVWPKEGKEGATAAPQKPPMGDDEILKALNAPAGN